MRTTRSKGRQLAAPLIVTVSLVAFGSAGCEKSEPESPKGPMVNPPGPDWKPKGSDAGEASDGEVDAGQLEVATGPDAGPANSELPPMPTDGPGFLRVAGARCLWIEHRGGPACPPNVPCNPPPPLSHEVQCPQPANPLHVTRRDDGSCYFNYSKPSTCPPQTRCNPPPPLSVPAGCPPEK